MSIKVRTSRPDKALRQIIQALETYSREHPSAEIETYRQNSVSVRIRIIDSAFKGKSRIAREEELWALLNELPEDIVAEISLVLLLTPDEAKRSLANVEFDDPIPSKL
jgi:stress-induced morphogen